MSAFISLPDVEGASAELQPTDSLNSPKGSLKRGKTEKNEKEKETPKKKPKKTKMVDLPEPEQVETKLVDLITVLEHLKKNEAQPVKKTSTRKSGGNWQCWSHEEEVFLVGAVLERFFSRGSLSATKKEASSSKNKCWETIKTIYDSTWAKYCEQNGLEKPPERSENALGRHYKVMKERSISKNSRNVVNFKAMYDEWQRDFNTKYNLLPENDFEPPKTESNYTKRDGTSSRGRWNFADEVILIGVVMEVFFQRGSLSSSHGERQKTGNDFWENLHSSFERVKELVNISNGVEVKEGAKPFRTAQALARHFKVMKVKLIESQGKINLKTFYKEWEEKYRKFWLQDNNEQKSNPIGSQKLSLDLKAINVQQQVDALKSVGSSGNTAALLTSLSKLSAISPRFPPFSPICRSIPSSPIEAQQTPAGTPSGNVLSPQPIVTQNGNATTYWLPVVLYNNGNEDNEKGKKTVAEKKSSLWKEAGDK